MKLILDKFTPSYLSSGVVLVEACVRGPLGSQVLKFFITETPAGFVVTDQPQGHTKTTLFENPFNTLHDATEGIKLLISDEVTSLGPVVDRNGKFRPPSPEEYREAKARNAINFAPMQKACRDCGWPVINGYCCTTCGSVHP